MIDEKYKWLYSYTLPCTKRGDEKFFIDLLKKGQFVSFLNGDYSRENVRKYFLIDHNVRELECSVLMNKNHRSAGYLHLALPYKIKEFGKEELVCRLVEPFDQMPLGQNKIFSPFEIKSDEERGVLYPGSEMLVSHAGIIAETCKKEDIARYIYEFEQRMAMAA